MDGMLSQEEINALLGNVDADSTSEEAASDAVQTSSDISKAEKLTPEESDALGEISNISMGTAATTLSILVNNRVDITTPTVSYTTNLKRNCLHSARLRLFSFTYLIRRAYKVKIY